MSQGEHERSSSSNKLVGIMTTLALLLLFWPLVSWLIGKIHKAPGARDRAIECFRRDSVSGVRLR